MSLSTGPPARQTAYHFMGLREIAQRIARREVSSVEVMKEVLAEVAAAEPVLNAFLWQSPRALRDAEHADRALDAHRPQGPLHGVPITVKDLILSREAPTTAGSRIFGAGLLTERDAPVLRRLRRAGAILLGKTNLHEIAMGVTSANEHFGPARNPWDPERISGGSSGGSAAAVAAGLGFASVGTDTRGSIRIPAACCGITGLKPTRGLVPTEGVIPLSWTLDHVGPMARSVEDAALLLGTLSGSYRRLQSYLAAIDAAPPRYRIGICPYYLAELDPEIEQAIREAITLLEQRGHRLVGVDVIGLAEAHAASSVITGAEAFVYHEAHLRDQTAGFGPLVRGRLEHGATLTATQFVKAKQARREVTEAFSTAFREVDCLIGATLPGFPPRIGETTVRIAQREVPILDAYTRLNSPANMAGVPALVVPCGAGADGLPIGLQLIGPAGRDEVVLAIGAEYQRETDWHRRRPGLRKTAGPENGRTAYGRTAAG